MTELLRNELTGVLGQTRVGVLRKLAALQLIDRRHLTCALATADGRIAAVESPWRLGVARGVVRAVLDYFSDGLDPADVVVTNDPFSGGAHLQDVSLLRPLYGETGLVGYALVQAPMPDLGGMALGGYYPFAEEIWAESIRVTPTKLHRRGNLQRDVLSMLTLNSRLPHLIQADLDTMVGALASVQGQVDRLVSRHGTVDCGQALNEMISDTAEKTALAIRTLSNGVWTGESAPLHVCLEEGKPVAAVRLTVTTDAIELDFSGSAPPAKGFVNSTTSTTTAAAIFPFLCLWPGVRANEGIFSTLSCSIPEETFLHARLPTSVGWSPYGASQAVVQAVTAALVQARCDLPSSSQLEAWTIAPPLPFAVSGCGRPGCPFPAPIG